MTEPDTPTATSETSNVKLDDGYIHVNRDGPRGRPVVLLLHGSVSSSRSWDALVPLLTASHHVVRVDQLGHGRSDKPVGPGYGVVAQADRVGVVLDRLGIESAVVIGHSSGGAVATALAERRTSQVAGVALVNCGPSLDAFIASGADEIDPEQWPPTDAQIERFASSGFSRADFVLPQDVLDDVHAMTLHTVTASMAGTRSYLYEQSLPSRLACVDKPLLVLFGAADRRWRAASAFDYEEVPGCRVELLPGLGHSPILEDPERTAEMLLPFTTSLRFAGGTGS